MKSTNKSFTFFDGLGLLFIGLKLASEIDWSWWIVLLPVIIPWSIVVFILVLSEIKKDKE